MQMRTPLRKFCQEEGISLRTAYNEINAGRLTITKVRQLTFVDDVDREAWRALAPKFTGNGCEVALKAAEQSMFEVGRLVSQGKIAGEVAIERLKKALPASGVQEDSRLLAKTG
jgi:hypothetical protein